jgi:hypothetical protein
MAAQVPATVGENTLAIGVSGSFFFDIQKFADAQRVATLLSSSSLLPAHFQKSIANCVIALNLAERLRVDPFMLMQNLYVVHGRPGIEGKLAIALVEGTGRFSPIKFKMEGSGKTKKGVARAESCTAYATEIKTGEVIEGPPVTWEMAEAEGWTKDKGAETSKWQTMPDLMFRYRSAMFFARVNCPGALLGLRSSDEIEDIEMVPAGADRTYTLKQDDKTDLSAAVAEFDQATADKPLMAQYITVASKHFKKTADEIKAEAVKDLPGFLAAYEKWAKAQGQKEAVKKGKAEEKPTAEPEMAPGPCVDREDKAVMTKEFCSKCAKREGCPTWE